MTPDWPGDNAPLPHAVAEDRLAVRLAGMVGMKRGSTEAETCHLNGWTVGTQLVGDEGYGPTVIEITAIGESAILGVTVSHDGKPPRYGRHESMWTLRCREWATA